MRYKVLLAVLVVALVVLAVYYVVVGNTVAVDDFDQSDNLAPDPNDPNPPSHDWDAYATFKVTCSAYWITNLVAHGDITLIEPTVEPFEDMATGRVYEDLGLLKGHEEMKGRIWINVTITSTTGPPGFEAYWQSDMWYIFAQHTIDNRLVVTWNTGRVFFENPGTYAVLVRMYAESLDWIPYKQDSQYQTFEVDMP